MTAATPATLNEQPKETKALTKGEMAATKILMFGAAAVAGVAFFYAGRAGAAMALGSVTYQTAVTMKVSALVGAVASKCAKYFRDVANGECPDEAIEKYITPDPKAVVPTVAKLEESSAELKEEIARLNAKVEDLQKTRTLDAKTPTNS